MASLFSVITMLMLFWILALINTARELEATSTLTSACPSPPDRVLRCVAFSQETGPVWTDGQPQQDPAIMEGPDQRTRNSSHMDIGDLSKKCTISKREAYCNKSSLHTVPQHLLKDIQVLDLNGNLIRELPSNAFAHYFRLNVLVLSYNRISSLQANAFYNLSVLHKLYLHGNQLLSDPTLYPDDIFCPLKALTRLRISFNFKHYSYPRYPDKAFSCLRSLESLTMNGFPITHTEGPFGAGFKKLTKLKTLVLSGRDDLCQLQALPNNTFEHVENVEYLTLSRYNIIGRNFQPGTFLVLKELRNLNIVENIKIGFQYLTTIFQDLNQLENLISLEFSYITNRYSLNQCLDEFSMKYFPKFLRTLVAKGNHLEAVDPHVIHKLSPSLKCLDVSGNPFTLGGYLQHLYKLQNLTCLYLRGLTDNQKLPTVYPYSTQPARTKNKNCTNLVMEKENFILRLPPKLEMVDMTNFGLTYTLTGLKVDKHNSLAKLKLSGNRFPRLKGPIAGLSSLTFLDMSHCWISSISKRFFNTFSSLETLRLDANDLGDFLGEPNNAKAFSTLTNLKDLNLSSNNIFYLQDVFSDLSSLTTLRLQDNGLAQFDMDFTHVQLLDLSRTSVTSLPKQMQAYFDHLINKAGMNVSIYMEKTPISCDCCNLQFLQWMTTSKAFSKPFHNYLCGTTDSGRRPIMDDYEETISVLKRQCFSHANLFYLVGTITATTCCLIISAIVYRFRWSIRYMYYAAYLHFTATSEITENSHEYDAFICYASEDAEFAEGILDRELSGRGLKIFLHGRDFKAGDYVSSNIVNAVCSSKKTVVLLTKALLDSYWCGYEIEMAKLEGVHSGRPVLIFVFLEEIPKRKLSRDLLYNIKNNTYVEYMSSVLQPDQLNLWWDKLASDIKN